MKLFLTGFMGTGKTTIGRRVASLLDRGFVDLDAVVEEKLGVSIADYFEARGEAQFRDVEADTLRDVAESETPAVVACGGGVVLRDSNIELMRRTGIVVGLTATPEAIARRTAGDEGRPLLAARDRLERISELLEQRADRYALADAVVDTEGDIASVSRAVIAGYERIKAEGRG